MSTKIDSTPLGVMRHQRSRICSTPVPPDPEAVTPAPKKQSRKRDAGPSQRVLLTPTKKKATRSKLSVNSPNGPKQRKKPTASTEEEGSKRRKNTTAPHNLCVTRGLKELFYLGYTCKYSPTTLALESTKSLLKVYQPFLSQFPNHIGSWVHQVAFESVPTLPIPVDAFCDIAFHTIPPLILPCVTHQTLEDNAKDSEATQPRKKRNVTSVGGN